MAFGFTKVDLLKWCWPSGDLRLQTRSHPDRFHENHRFESYGVIERLETDAMRNLREFDQRRRGSFSEKR
ncbi:hypothetical protein GCK72_014248 [Caenorhabditis remanei]|uniref:Uncharacterized protein n=1 Tax=Caenorhabditis remanei TaxID=31234 RepID=A0A6A5GT52_CAERE|nr:hypothetical protein GCK72_014248 [Caenorhabditis remanei]KAF1757791.1 hypothetical protein GCK72_014248 [Caenorhabditis remanei]